MFVDYVSPRIFRSALVKYKEESNNYTTIGVDWGQQFAEKTIMMKGRYINQEDVKNRTKNVAIGRLVEQDLFGTNELHGSIY